MQIGWLFKGEQYSHNEMLAYAASYPAEFPFSPSMLEDMLERPENARERISPTMLTGCARKEWLKRQDGAIWVDVSPKVKERVDVNYYEDVFKAYAKWRGKLAHRALEAEQLPDGAIVERLFSKPLSLPDGTSINITGQPDLILPDSGLLVDYKTVASIVTSPKASWVPQLSVYAWLVAPDIVIKRGLIQQFAMDKPARLELQLWSFAQVEAWLIARVPAFKKVLDGAVTVDTLAGPLIMGIDEGAWFCREYCPLYGPCRKLMEWGK
jgi:hypothetical protein